MKESTEIAIVTTSKILDEFIGKYLKDEKLNQ
jgi:hypothetical protein